MTRLPAPAEPGAVTTTRRAALQHARRHRPAAPPRSRTPASCPGRPDRLYWPHAATTRRGRSGTDRGASAAQLAVITPMFMFLLMLIVQVALVEHAHQVAATAARQAAEAARAAQATPDAGDARARLVLDQLGPTLLHSATVTIDPGPNSVTVTISGQAPSLIPGLHPTITARSTGTLERIHPAEDTP